MKVRFSAWLLTMAISFLTLSCSDVSKDSIAVRIAISRTPLSSPLYIAATEAFFAQCGLVVSYKEYAGGLRSLEALTTGEADFATGSDTLMAFNAQSNKDLTIVANFASSDNDTKVLQREFSTTGAAFRIGYYSDTASEYLLRMYLALTPTIANIELVPTTPEEMVAAWQRGELDRAVIWEPYAFQMVKNAPITTTVLDSKGLYRLNFQLLSHSTFLDQAPEVAERMVHAINLASHFIAQNPQIAQATVQEQLQLDDDFIEWDWPNYQFKIDVGRQLLLTAQENARWLKEVANHKHSLRVDANQISSVTLNMRNPSFETSKQFCEQL